MGLNEYVVADKRLNELYDQIQEIKKLIEYDKERGYDGNLEKYYNEIATRKNEMTEILKKYDKLNRPEYRIDITSEEKRDQTVVETSVPNNANEETKEIVLNEQLTIFRTSLRQKYEAEIVVGSLDKISFLEYLERLPNVPKELIAYERQNEGKSITIYAAYLRYYAALEDKSLAMKFSEFAETRFKITDLDVPYHSKEEYEEMLKKDGS
ncbi:MAG: hypothetical protein E7167_03775 [Firmicutes bacterium]|nr:hypothetical protein [Bacillota bacterium]